MAEAYITAWDFLREHSVSDVKKDFVNMFIAQYKYD